MNLRLYIKKIIRKFGYDINKYPSIYLRRRIKIYNNNSINVLLDVGANIGQYATEMRALGYNKQIISFEPYSTAYEELTQISKKDKNWICYRKALGATDENLTLRVSDHSPSNSFLKASENLKEIVHKMTTFRDELVQVNKLDSIYTNLVKTDDNVYLKIDTQGFEKKVLIGADNSLSHIKVVQLEMSMEEMYEGEILLHEISNHLYNKGFTLHSIEPGFYDPKSLRLYQADGIFVKRVIK